MDEKNEVFIGFEKIVNKSFNNTVDNLLLNMNFIFYYR